MAPDASHNTLAEDIKSSTVDDPVRTSLDTNRRIIRRVTDGIYREPWAAFRELISNAYDADARTVRITTDWPRFKEIHISDDGNGMSIEALAYLIKNIGGSAKRTKVGSEIGVAQLGNSDTSPAGRKLIGKIGIGLFAVNHFTQHFQIITKKKGDPERSIASILLETYQEGDDEEDQSTEAGQVAIWREKATNPDQQGTSIILRDIRPEIKNSLRSVLRWKALGEDESSLNSQFPLRPPEYHIGDYTVDSGSEETRQSESQKTLESGPSYKLPWSDEEKNPLKRFSSFFDALSERDRADRRPDLMTLDNYFQMLWKLSLSCPVQYIDQHPFDICGGSNMHFYRLKNEARKSADICEIPEDKTLKEFFGLECRVEDPLGGFNVFFDDVELRRPIRLPWEMMGKPQRVERPLMFVGKHQTSWSQEAEKRGGGKISFEAYLYWNSGILPKENNGVLITVRGASGILFDQTFLNYQVSELTRLKQITAEIFVQEGLEAALNADRESFNFSHPHYLFLRNWLHSAIRQLTNKHKEIGTAELKAERNQKAKSAEADHRTLLQNIWVKSKGEDEDKFDIEFEDIKRPDLDIDGEIKSVPATPLPAKINDRSIVWPDDLNFLTVDKDVVESLVVILEAYGLFENLTPEVRGSLLNDLLTALEKR